jgi:pimeloyl-ACP methyl ester carboxylesterase
MAQVAVLVPGIMGSELWLSDDLIWPGSVSELLLPYAKMAELLRPDLRVGDVIRSFSISSQYQDLIDDLTACGFSEAAAPPTLVVFPYDWRKSNALPAEALADRLDAIAAAHGADTEVLLIAHSMGGLISRYYLESGRFAGRPGFAAVKWLITLGTPHRGSPLALTAAMGLEKRLFLNADQVLQVASDPRYPSLYELLPPAGEPFAWNDRAQAAYGVLDIYDPAVAAKLGPGLVAANLDAAKAFREKLDPARHPTGVRYFTFAGNQQSSLSAVRLLDAGAKYRLGRVEPDDAGDGTVPIWSSVLPGIQSHLVGGEHGTLYKTRELRRILAVLLGKPGVLAPATAGVEISVRDRVVHPSSIVPVVLGFPSPVTSIRGELRLERASDPSPGPATFTQVGAPQPVSYAGAEAERLSLRLRAPAIRGAYRVAFYSTDPGGAPVLAGADDLFVQQPP